MYEYRFYNTASTKTSEINDEFGSVIGGVTKFYNKFYESFVDFLINGNLFVRYRLTDSDGKVIFESNRDTNLFKRRQYHIKYYKNDEETYIHLVDKKSFDIGEITTFDYNGDTYELKKDPFDWATIKKDGSPIAEWKSTLKIPFMAYFELLDDDYQEDKLLLLGIFHTYLHAPS